MSGGCRVSLHAPLHSPCPPSVVVLCRWRQEQEAFVVHRMPPERTAPTRIITLTLLLPLGCTHTNGTCSLPLWQPLPLWSAMLHVHSNACGQTRAVQHLMQAASPGTSNLFYNFAVFVFFPQKYCRLSKSKSAVMRFLDVQIIFVWRVRHSLKLRDCMKIIR